MNVVIIVLLAVWILSGFSGVILARNSYTAKEEYISGGLILLSILSFTGFACCLGWKILERM